MSDASLAANEETLTQSQGLSSSLGSSQDSSLMTSQASSTLSHASPVQPAAINSIMNFIYPNYQQNPISTSVAASESSVSVADQPAANLSVAAAVSGASAILSAADEPELKKVKLAHFTFFQNQLFADSLAKQQHAAANMLSPPGYTSAATSNSIYIAHKKLEERIGGILCCTVCLDLPQTAIYQVFSISYIFQSYQSGF